jgi:hypothetical protein
MIVATIVSTIFIGVALISAKEQASDGSSEGDRPVPPVLQSPAPQLYFRKMDYTHSTRNAAIGSTFIARRAGT